MPTYRVSGEALLRLATMAAASPAAEVETILGILHGVELEDEPAPEMPDVLDGPDLGGEPVEDDADAGGAPGAKPVKPE